MLHQVARAIGGRPLFRTWAEARWLWVAVLRATPGRVALVLMPDHLHLIHPTDVRRSVAAALSGFVRRRHRARGERGPVFEPLPEPRPIADRKMLRRTVRYVHLNPCRRDLVRDPLAWPFSTHRDACGLTLPAARPVESDPLRFHAYVSSDPDASVEGTQFPEPKVEVTDPRAVLHAVSALTRTPLSSIGMRGTPHRLVMAATSALCGPVSRAAIAEHIGVDPRSVKRASASDAVLRAVSLLVDDPRFPALHDQPLRWPDPPGRRG